MPAFFSILSSALDKDHNEFTAPPIKVLQMPPLFLTADLKFEYWTGQNVRIGFWNYIWYTVSDILNPSSPILLDWYGGRC